MLDLRPLIVPAVLLLGAVAVYGLARLAAWMQAWGWIDLSGRSVRRGGGHALLGLQQFIDPGAEHILVVDNGEQREAPEYIGDDDPTDPDAILADLADALARPTIDPEEVRRHLSITARSGHDWRSLFDQAVRSELAGRPYRAPSMPPPSRVAPIE